MLSEIARAPKSNSRKLKQGRILLKTAPLWVSVIRDCIAFRNEEPELTYRPSLMEHRLFIGVSGNRRCHHF